MKRFILAVALTFVASMGYCAQVWKSSNTATVDTARGLCVQNSSSSRHVLLHGACVNTATAGTLTFYNTYSTAASPIGAISTANQGCLFYDVLTSSGLSYANSATANVTILYQCE